MAGSQIDFLMTPFVDINGAPLAGGTVEFYLEGTSTPVTVYAEKALSTSLGSTVTLDSNGVKLCFAATTSFLKIVVKDSGGSTLYTYDGIGLTLGGPLASDAYLRDGSLALSGNMPGAGYDLENLGNIDLASGKSIDINHGHGYSPTSADMVVFGGSTGYIRQYIASSMAKIFFDATEIWNWTASTVKALIPLDMNSQKITSLATATAGTDAVNKTQMDTADALNLPLAGGTMSGQITLSGTPSGSEAAMFSQIPGAPVMNSASGNATALTGTAQEIGAVTLNIPAGKTWQYVEVTFTTTLVSNRNIEATDIKIAGTTQTIYSNFVSVTTNNSDDAAMINYTAIFVPTVTGSNLDVEFFAKTSGTGDTTGDRKMIAVGHSL